MISEFAQLEGRKGPICWYAGARLRLSKSDLAKLDEALQSVELQSKAVWRWLKLHGIIVSPSTVARHRRGECSC